MARRLAAAAELLHVPLMWHVAVSAGLLAGCIAYQPDSFTYGWGSDAAFAGQRVAIGCLDVAVARRADHEGSAVLAYRFGNRCNGAALVDLGRVAVVARFADGAEARLDPYDPGAEIQPARLAGRGSGGEAIAYPGARRALQICAELSTITAPSGARGAASRPDPDAPQRWLCFASSGAADADAAGAADAGDADAADAGAAAAAFVAAPAPEVVP